MGVHPLAGQPAPQHQWIDVARLENDYYQRSPNVEDPRQRVSFGTSGHRGSSLDGSFTEAHILAITQAICEFRQSRGIDGPLFLGKDTHALSGPAQRTALEVLAANRVHTCIQPDDGFTPTPAISRAILVFNQGRQRGLADGIVITPSHNPPADGGIKYNPPHGGPADTEVTGWIEARANALLADGNREVRRVPFKAALKADTTHLHDFVLPYVKGLAGVINMEAIRASGLRIGVDPLGGAAAGYWAPVREHYGLNLSVLNPKLDPRFSFMPLDHDGQIRMDCSSPYAMAGLLKLKDQFDVAFGNDPDADRHGIVTRSAGLLNPNHYLAVAIDYLLGHRPNWAKAAAVGKTLVSSSLIDRVVAAHGRRLYEVPVGFKYFAPALFDGSCCFCGEESAGASFLQQDGSVWVTDKDGLIMGLLAAEIMAVTGQDPGQRFQELAARFGQPFYMRIDAPASPNQKAALKQLSPDQITVPTLAGDPILAKITRAPGNQAPVGGIKVVTARGWFAARPSGTENVYKLYAESFVSQAHLETIVAEAQTLIRQALG
jgi:phosphoglucomutase